MTPRKTIHAMVLFPGIHFRCIFNTPGHAKSFPTYRMKAKARKRRSPDLRPHLWAALAWSQRIGLLSWQPQLKLECRDTIHNTSTRHSNRIDPGGGGEAKSRNCTMNETMVQTKKLASSYRGIESFHWGSKRLTCWFTG